MAQTYIGLSLGSHTIKLVEVGSGKEGIQLLNVAVAPTPPGAVAGGQVNDPESVAQTIKQLLSNNNIRTKKTISALTGQSVIVRIISVPRMAANELREVMRHEIERHIPYSIDEVVWDYRVIERPDKDPNAPNIEVLFAAAQEDTVRSHVNLLQQAGLEPHVIEVESLAVCRPLLELRQADGGGSETVAVLDIGAANTEIAIYKDRLLHFPRTVPIGGEALTKAIAETLGLSEAQAERLKREFAEIAARYQQAPPLTETETTTRPAGAGMFVPTGQTLDQAEMPFVPDAEPAQEEGPAELPFSLGDTAIDEGAVLSFDLEEDLIITPASSETAPGPSASAPGATIAPEEEPLGASGPALDFDFSIADDEADNQFEVVAIGDEEEQGPVFDLGGEETATGLPPAFRGGLPASETEGPMGAPVEEEVQTALEEEDEDRRKRELYDAMIPVLGELVTEVRRSLEYYRSRHEGAEVNRLIVVGGTARMPGLADFLAEELGIPAERGDPVAALAVANPNLTNEFLYELSPVLTVAIGLGVRDLMD